MTSVFYSSDFIGKNYNGIFVLFLLISLGIIFLVNNKKDLCKMILDTIRVIGSDPFNDMFILNFLCKRSSDLHDADSLVNFQEIVALLKLCYNIA
jgi:hypothetical protein